MREKTMEYRALELVSENIFLSEVFQLEPAMYQVLKSIISYIEITNLDHAYVTFKKQCQSLVGESAKQEQLRTEQHYVAVLGFIETLLSWVREEKQWTEEDIEEEFLEYQEDMEDVEDVIFRTMQETRRETLRYLRDTH